MTPLFNKLLLTQRVKRLSLVDKAKPWAQRTIVSLKLFRVFTIILGCFALILTFSRSAWVAFIALFVLLKIKNCNFILNFKSFTRFDGASARRAGFPAHRPVRRNLGEGGNLGVGGLAFVIFIVFYLGLPYFQSLTPESESVFVRNELNSAAVSMWWNSSSFLPLNSYLLPRLFGIGLGNFLVELPKYYPHRDIFFLQPVHNIYLLLLSETGIIGLSVFLFFIFQILCSRLCRIRKNKKEDNSFFLPLTSSLITLLLLGAVDHYPLTLQQGRLLFTILISFSFL